MAPSYVVAGGGRTGSHWLQEIIRHITGYDLIKQPPQTLIARSVFHTHNQSDLIACGKAMGDRAVLILSRRRDLFEQAISLAVATHTDEWHEYSSRPVDAIELSLDKVNWLIYRCRVWNEEFDRLVRRQWQQVVEIDYEDLRLHANHVEQWVADRLGVVHAKSPGAYRAPNHRDYRAIISNYDALYQVFGAR